MRKIAEVGIAKSVSVKHRWHLTIVFYVVRYYHNITSPPPSPLVLVTFSEDAQQIEGCGRDPIKSTTITDHCNR